MKKESLLPLLLVEVPDADAVSLQSRLELPPNLPNQ